MLRWRCGRKWSLLGDGLDFESCSWAGLSQGSQGAKKAKGGSRGQAPTGHWGLFAAVAADWRAGRLLAAPGIRRPGARRRFPFPFPTSFFFPPSLPSTRFSNRDGILSVGFAVRARGTSAGLVAR
jgi:hypothetical protein